MRRLRFLTLLAAGGCAPRTSGGTLPSASSTGAPVELAVLGDSLALGTGASDGSHGFAFETYRIINLGRPGSEITNYAIGGSTTRDVVRLQVARLRERHVDCAIVCVGGNDVARAIGSAAFAASYDALLHDIRRTVPHAALVVLGVPDLSLSPLFADRAGEIRALAAADDRAVRTAARAVGAEYVDVFALTRGRRDLAKFLSADRFHPSDYGHWLIAMAVIPVVRRALNRQGFHRL